MKDREGEQEMRERDGVKEMKKQNQKVREKMAKSMQNAKKKQQKTPGCDVKKQILCINCLTRS